MSNTLLYILLDTTMPSKSEKNSGQRHNTNKQNRSRNTKMSDMLGPNLYTVQHSHIIKKHLHSVTMLTS